MNYYYYYLYIIWCIVLYLDFIKVIIISVFYIDSIFNLAQFLTTFMKVEKVINCFYAYVWKHHDLLKFFMSDQDTKFIFNIWKHMCKMLKINVKLSTTYHFEINDQIKKVNAIMKHYLQVFINYMQNNWIK